MSEKNGSRARYKVARSFRVGGKVYVPFGNTKRIARIIEDRGAIGRGGRRLLRVSVVNGKGQAEQVFEIPAAEVTPARAGTGRRAGT